MVPTLIISICFLAYANAVTDVKNGSAIFDNVPDNVFNGVYSECFLHLSYSCLQKKTLLYLKELNNLSEVSVIGDYVKFVKINKSSPGDEEEESKSGDTEELAFMIDKAIDNFFDNHVLKFYALGRNISIPRNVEEFVGRKKRKGGGGGGGHGGGGGGHDDGGKKKMMMMAMMCMKMKLMMMVPAMMGMMGMMSFKGMMFSMMSFMLSKMMLLMKILEKKGGPGLGSGGGGGGLDGGWPAAGGGGGAWMPAGGQDYAGGGGGGYDANGQWQSRSIVITPDVYKTIEDNPAPNIKLVKDEKKYGNVDGAIENYARDKWDRKTIDNGLDDNISKPKTNKWLADSANENFNTINKPEISFISRAVRYNKNKEKGSHKKPVLVYKRSNVNFDFDNPENVIAQENESIGDNYKTNLRSKRDLRFKERQPDFDPSNDHTSDEESRESTNRQKRSIIDILQSSYIYWVNRILGINNNRRTNPQRYKVINGVKYVYYPYKLQKPKMPKEMQLTEPQTNDLKTLVAVEDFIKGEIVEGAIESRMNKKKFINIKDTVNNTMEDDPWE